MNAWVALVGPEVEENLSLRYLAATLAAAGVRSEIYAFNSAADFSRILGSLLAARPAPTVVGLSLAFQWRATDVLALGMGLRAGGYQGHVTAGGHFATFAHEELLRDFAELDSICRFEAEATLVELVGALVDGQPLDGVAGLALRGPDGARLTAPRPLPELPGLPWPDRRGAPARCFGHAIMPLVGSRGCYGRCHFCSIAAWQTEGGGRRFRLREVDDIADEMAAQQRARGVEIFVFQDDNFFLPKPARSLARIHALADALAARGVHRFATVVKARADDLHEDVFTALVERLHCLRAYVGIESHAASGLETLGRATRPVDNERALALVKQLGLYICFNLLPFDPDATLDAFAANVEFMETVADHPFCVGRVELYAGTPILARLQREGRCRGDYLQWDYDLADPRLERLFRWFMDCLAERNYGDESAVVALWLMRFDVEACRFFHPAAWRPAWRDQAIAITRTLSLHTTSVLRALVELARADPDPARARARVAELAREAAQIDRAVIDAAHHLADDMTRAVGALASLCEVRHILDTGRQPAPQAPSPRHE